MASSTANLDPTFNPFFSECNDRSASSGIIHSATDLVPAENENIISSRVRNEASKYIDQHLVNTDWHAKLLECISVLYHCRKSTMMDSEITSLLCPFFSSITGVDGHCDQILWDHGWRENSFWSAVNLEKCHNDLLDYSVSNSTSLSPSHTAPASSETTNDCLSIKPSLREACRLSKLADPSQSPSSSQDQHLELFSNPSTRTDRISKGSHSAWFYDDDDDDNDDADDDTDHDYDAAAEYADEIAALTSASDDFDNAHNPNKPECGGETTVQQQQQRMSEIIYQYVKGFVKDVKLLYEVNIFDEVNAMSDHKISRGNLKTKVFQVVEALNEVINATEISTLLDLRSLKSLINCLPYENHLIDKLQKCLHTFSLDNLHHELHQYYLAIHNNHFHLRPYSIRK